jgi:hypothetical protein
MRLPEREGLLAALRRYKAEMSDSGFGELLRLLGL